MSETNSNVSLQQNPTLDSSFHFLDPVSLILNQNSNSDQFVPLKLTSTVDFYLMERGPRYEAYAELRERKLRMKYLRQQEFDVEPEQEPELKLTPPRKQVKFQSNLVSGRKGSSFLAQSVPDFSAALRKENRKPATNALPPLTEMTPPPAKSSARMNGALSNSRGSKSASAGEKKGGGGGGGGRVLMARKSYASIDELKSMASATANAINGENRGGRNGRKTVLAYRQY